MQEEKTEMADFGESQLSFLMGFHRNRKDGN